jgi:hypothetical protein
LGAETLLPELSIGDLLTSQLLAAVALVMLKNKLGGSTSLSFADEETMFFVIDALLKRKTKVCINHYGYPAQAEGLIKAHRIVFSASTANAVEAIMNTFIEATAVHRLIRFQPETPVHKSPH